MKPLAMILRLASPASMWSTSFEVHEWGTFTSLQRHDGVQMEWLSNPTEDLPSFVYRDTDSKATRTGAFSLYALQKSGTLAKLRMETPVIYFHSPNEIHAAVRVDLPEGRPTEWYPVAHDAGPSSLPSKGEASDFWGGGPWSRNFLEWRDITIHPPGIQGKLPTATTAGHDYAARDAKSNPLSVPGRDKTEQESFLFYRGVAHFESPMELREPSASGLRITNKLQEEPIPNALILDYDGERRKRLWTGPLGGKAKLSVSSDEMASWAFTTVPDLILEMVQHLTTAVRYPGIPACGNHTIPGSGDRPTAAQNWRHQPTFPNPDCSRGRI